VLARDEPALPVNRVTVGVAARRTKDADRAVGLVVAHHAVVRDVGEQRVAPGREVHRALGPAGAGPQSLHMGCAVEAGAEALVQDFVVAHRHPCPPRAACFGPHHSGFWSYAACPITAFRSAAAMVYLTEFVIICEIIRGFLNV